MTTHDPAARREELARNLDRVRSRIDQAARDAGRSPQDVELVVVTKFFPASDVRLLAELGVRQVGENRFQEAREKIEETRDLPLRWHYIGGLQSNKAAAVAREVDVVESVDRAKLVPGLSRGAQEAGRRVECLIQVGLDPETAEQDRGRSGATPAEVAELAAAVGEAPGLLLRGVMAVAPLDVDPAEAFGRLASIRATVLAEHPLATVCSAGMSGDLEQAVAAGATHVRIGRAVLGERPQNR